jgi:hypothetical protein
MLVALRLTLMTALLGQALPPTWYDKIVPSWGAVILFVLLVFLTWWRERGWKSVAESRKETIGEKDGLIQKLRDEKDKLVEDHHKKEETLVRENQTLHTRTDLGPVSTAITDWIEESRGRFTHALEQLKTYREDNAKNDEALVKSLAGLVAEMQSYRATAETMFKSVADSLEKHVLEDHSAHKDDMEQKTQLVSIMSKMEERMTLNQQLVIEFLDKMRKEPTKGRHRSAQRGHTDGKQDKPE